ncbi:hemerythrin domain-containing protein [Trinickia dabaoshanensis]|nr:hemerythrin domain-containing protein [Trinickia dabaoshanensis]
MKPINPMTKPAPSFDEPLEMLKACHERIAAQCTTLEKLEAHLRANGIDEQAQQAARNIMRYFDTAGPHHHADEEQDLLPLLAQASLHRGSPLAQHIASLPEQHRTLDALWARLRAVLADIAEGTATPLESALVEAFAKAYREHIAFEEQEVFPAAQAWLDASQLEKLSAAMVARRKIEPR